MEAVSGDYRRLQRPNYSDASARLQTRAEMHNFTRISVP